MTDAPPRTPARPRRPSRAAGTRHDPVRLAVARAYLLFAGGGTFLAQPPPGLTGEGERRRYVNLLRGMVRHRRLLEADVARLSARPPERLEPELMALALLGLYQLRFLEVPPHAAVYETVALAGPLRRAHARGWLNGVLRSAQREGLRGEDVPGTLPLAVRTSHPDWLVERWSARYGLRCAGEICEANNRYEGAAVRVETHRIAPADLLRRLADEGVAARPHPLLPGALWMERLGELLRAPAFREGLCYVQDAPSQLLAAWLAPHLKGRVLDVCAAPGGKLTHLQDAGPAPARVDFSPARWLVGADRSPGRLARVRENLRRLQRPALPLLAADGVRLPFADGGPGRGWDAVLLDAPCSATGMIRKYPELKWRKHGEHIPLLAATQRALLAEAARVTRPGGVIVYATCSLEPEENEEAVAAFLSAHPAWRRLSFSAWSPPDGLGVPADSLLSPAGELLLLPGPHQMGLFAALLERVAPGGRP